MEFDNKNRGSLWMQPKTVTKQDGTSFEAYNGNLNVEGVEYWLDGYKRTVTMKDGTKKEVMGLKVKPKLVKQEPVLDPSGQPIPF